MITNFNLFLESVNNENRYFVYCFVDTRKPGKYIFGDFQFDYEPIYIGKGQGNRPQRHFTLYKTANTRFYSKLKSIMEGNDRPEIIYINKDLTEIDAFKQEVYFIKLIGRIEKGGTLTNLTDGGDGQSGFKFSDETRAKMSFDRTGEKNPMSGKHHSDEGKINISLSKKGSVSWRKGVKGVSPETSKKMSTSAKIRIQRDGNPMEGKKHRSESIEKMKKNHIAKYGKDNPNFGRVYSQDEKTTDTWKLTNIDGREEIVNNLTKFCKENGLNASCMREISYGTQKKHRGWIKVEKLTDNVKKKKV